MDFLIDCILDSFHDTWLMFILLFVVYLFIDSAERKTSENDSFFWELQKYGPLFGALLGLVPQCGFSILAAMLYAGRNITLGTMIAVFLATSDEAIPILISEPAMLPSLGILLVLKFILAALTGWVIDHLLYPHQKILYFSEMEEEDDLEDVDVVENQNPAACSCCYRQYPVWLSALLRTIKIYAFIFIVTLIMTLITGWIGEENLAAFLNSSRLLQPLAAALFGFIPNCAATVVLCQLYAGGALTFGSLLAGLMTNAGLGLVALFQYDPDRKSLFKVVLLMLIPALICGYLVQAFLPAFF